MTTIQTMSTFQSWIIKTWAQITQLIIITKAALEVTLPSELEGQDKMMNHRLQDISHNNALSTEKMILIKAYQTLSVRRDLKLIKTYQDRQWEFSKTHRKERLEMHLVLVTTQMVATLDLNRSNIEINHMMMTLDNPKQMTSSMDISKRIVIHWETKEPLIRVRCTITRHDQEFRMMTIIQ